MDTQICRKDRKEIHKLLPITYQTSKYSTKFFEGITNFERNFMFVECGPLGQALIFSGAWCDPDRNFKPEVNKRKKRTRSY